MWGHLYLLIPSADQDALEHLQAEIALKLWQAHRGDLSLIIGYLPMAPIDFVSEQIGGQGFAKKWQAIAEQVEARKRQRWMELGAERVAQYLFTPHGRGC